MVSLCFDVRVRPTCRTCQHPLRSEIDEKLASGHPMRAIARQYGISTMAIYRHKCHIGRGLDERDRERALSALQHANWVVEKLRRLAETSVPAPRQFLAVAETLIRAVNVLGRITGEIQPNHTQLFVALGVKGEDEIRHAVELKRSMENLTHEEGREDAVAALKALYILHPEWAVEDQERLFGSRSYARVLPDHSEVVTNGNGAASSMQTLME